MTTRDNESGPDDRRPDDPLYDAGRGGARAAEPSEDFVGPDSQEPDLRDRDSMLEPDGPDGADERVDMTDRGALTDRGRVSDRDPGTGRDAGRDVVAEPDAFGNQGTTTDRDTLAERGAVGGQEEIGDRDALGGRGALGDQGARDTDAVGDTDVAGGRGASADAGALTDREVLADSATTDAGIRGDNDVTAGRGSLSAPAGLSPVDEVGSGTAEAGLGSPATGASVTGTGMEGDGEPLVRSDLAMDLRTRWEVIQQGFVDDPRNAVSDADSLVDEVLHRLSDGFNEQKGKLETQWHDGEPSTEDLRSALQRYRAFFRRLLDV